VADRCLVFSEDHSIVAEGAPRELLAERDLLLGVNLIHEHSHFHESTTHHAHEHDFKHHLDEGISTDRPRV
jgi:cobalt/nickel transport system ATP-binding protein